MRTDKLLLHSAVRPSLQALLHGSSCTAHGADIHHRRVLVIESLSYSRQPPYCLTSHRSSAKPHLLNPLSSTAPDPKRHSLLLIGPSDGPEPSQPSSSQRGISDHEYQTRVGKACRVLVDSLPDFMSKGVVDLDDLDSDDHSRSTSSTSPSRWSAKGLFPSLSPFLGQSLLRRSSLRAQQDTVQSADTIETPAFDSLYHPSIAFEFRPPLPHIGIGKSDETAAGRNASAPTDSGSPFRDSNDHLSRGPTICFSGRTVYVASSHLLRHALSALFHDVSLHLESARFQGRSKPGSSWPGISPYIRHHAPCGQHSDSSGPDMLVVRLRFEGVSRVSSTPHTYTVIFKYEFDRITGMVARHLVDNVQPVPGSKVWAGLTNVWGNLSPAGAAAAPGGGSASCSHDLAPRGCR